MVLDSVQPGAGSRSSFLSDQQLWRAVTFEAKSPKRVRLADLPEDDGFEFLRLGSGFAIVSADGAYVVDDWHRRQLDIADIEGEFRRACRRFDDIRAATTLIGDLQDEIDRFLEGGRAAAD